MATRWGFLAGLLVGVAAGIVGTLLLQPEARREATAGLSTPAPQSERAGVATLGTRGPPPSAPAPTPSPDPAPPPAEPDPGGQKPEAPKPEAPKDSAFNTTLAEVRAKLNEVRTADPGSAPVLELIQTFRALIEHTDPQIAQLGGRALTYLAGRGKLRDQDVQSLAKEFASLDAGAAARPALAGAVALAWARDERLADWFERIPAVEEPAIRATVVEALDESASAAYREYLLRLSRAEQDADVLEHAWHEDPITVAMTREWAPRLIAAVEHRVEEGGLPPVVRGRAVFAIGLAAVHESAAAAAAIGRLLNSEEDAGVGAYGRAVLDAIEREEANVQTLDRLWAEHRRSFGAE